jgi:hypothetical protein
MHFIGSNVLGKVVDGNNIDAVLIFGVMNPVSSQFKNEQKIYQVRRDNISSVQCPVQ